MILEQLSLRNFCLYRGEQSFNLAPVQRQGKHRPIVLFGGINGGGKTTLFDAIQLALYGPRARCSKRLNLSYEDFLRQSVHQGVSLTEGAGITLTFRHAVEGQEHQYEVRRSWKVEDGKFRDSLSVFQDGLFSSSLSGNWTQLVEELIPLEISQLFFFDGEKIRALAEDASSGEALGASIKALLGLDIVERLIADAVVLQTRLARQAGTPEQRAQAAALEEQYRDLKGKLATLTEQRTSLENRRQRAATELEEAEGTFAAAGGRHWQARQERIGRLGELNSLIKELDGQLVALAAGELPLAMVPDLLEGVRQEDARECEAAEAEIVQRLLIERDARLLEVLHAAQLPPRVLQLVADHLSSDRSARRAAGLIPAGTSPAAHALSEGARSLLHHLLGQRLAELVGDLRQLLDKRGGAVQEREDVERALAATPAETDIGQVLERLKTATQNLTLLNDQASRLDETIAARKRELEECEGRLRRLWEGKVAEEFEQEDFRRMVLLAGRTRETMQEFLRRVTERKIDRLSLLITESFRFLLRKQTLVERIFIDPASFSITLYDQAGQALSRQRLSEGEKQIFAVAVLWGLARASARPLPAVIDTPMARLDAAHRHHLVERYFPNASHQVIIFSTDTEVDREHYRALQPFLARAYHLRYDDQNKVTVGEEGYFWNE
jgi:DNA sulfur modification protein DndD